MVASQEGSCKGKVMGWVACDTCGASYRDEEKLTQCPRCKRDIYPETSPISLPATVVGPFTNESLGRFLVQMGYVVQPQ
jgi:uncharacterized paraquat-inducible protein A